MRTRPTSRGLATAFVLAGVLGATAPGVMAAGRHVYVANDLNNKISQLRVGPGGLLSPLSPPTQTLVDNNANSYDFSFTPNARTLFVGANGPSTIARFSIGSGGELTRAVPPNIATGTNPTALAVSPDGRSAYTPRSAAVFGDPGGIRQFDVSADGGLSAKSPAEVATVAGGASDVALSPDGKSLYASDYDRETIEQFNVAADGKLTPKNPASVPAGNGAANGSGTGRIKVSPDGRNVYVGNFGSGVINQFTVGAGGALQAKSPAFVSAGGLGASAAELELTPDGRNLYITTGIGNNGNGTVFQYSIAADGTLSPKTPAGVPAGHFGTRGVAMAPDGRSLFVSNSAANTISQFDIGATGLLTPKTPATVPTAGAQAGDIAVDPNQGPVAAFATGPAYAQRATQFNGLFTQDDGSPGTFAWDFGDGTSGTGAAPTHTYARTGTYQVTLRTVDDEGCSTGDVYNGHQFLCKGTPAAVITRSVQVTVAPPGTKPPGKCFGKRVTLEAVPGRRTVGTKRADVILGSSKGDRIDGRGGKDVICAGSGNDRVQGGAGNDKIGGGKGNDRLAGSSGNDRLAGDSGKDRLAGDSGKDILKGGTGNDVLGGGKGNDRLFGNSGKDRLTGGAGKDKLAGGAGKDKVKA